MLYVAILLFIVAALLGSVLLLTIMKNQLPPRAVALLHGSFAGVGLLVAIAYAATGHFAGLLITSIVILILAALGGSTMFIKHVTGKPIPKTIALAHPVIALVGVVLLIIYTVRIH